MDLPTFIEVTKRQTGFGDYTATNYTSDQPSEDIINFLNSRMRRFWRKHPWDWSIEEISQVFSGGVSDMTLGSNVGRILSLGLKGQTRTLKPISFIYYIEWKKSKDAAQGLPGYYVRIGRSSNNLKIKLIPTPEEGGTLEGFGQARHTNYTTSNIASNTGIAYFPDEVHDILLAGVRADVYELLGKPELSKIDNQLFENMIQDLIAEEQKNKPDEVPTTLAPDYYRRRTKLRGTGTNVV